MTTNSPNSPTPISMADFLGDDFGTGTAQTGTTIEQAHEQALAGIERLQVALEQQDPGLGNFCNQINSQLRQFPELVHILSAEQIGVIVQAFCNKKFEYLDKKNAPKVRKTTNKAALPEGGLMADLL